jgi:hypothetical protein
MNRFGDANEQLPVRSSQHDQYRKDKVHVAKLSARSTRPLERAEIDDTELDLVIVDEKTKQPIGRPWLTFEICPFTNLVVDFRLSSPSHHGAEV